jgi:hypothetical protein
MSHHIAFGCGIEVAGYNYRTVATQLTDAVEYQGDPFATSHLPYMVEVSVEGKEFFCGFLVAEHGPGCDAYAGSVPTHRAGHFRSLAEPEVARIAKLKTIFLVP